MTYYGECAFEHINQKSYFLDGLRISGYSDTKFTTMVWIEEILRKCEDPEIAKILNSEVPVI